MTTKQLNYKTLPVIAVTDGATTPALPASDAGAMAYSSTLGKPVTWNGTAWSLDYAHPTNHPADVITQDANNRFVTDAEKTAWNAKIDAVKTINGQSILGTGDLTIAGSNSFVGDIILYNEYDPIKIGKAPHKNGPWSSVDNYCIGAWPMTYNKTGIYNIAIGKSALMGSLDYINPSDTSPKTYANVKGNVGAYNTAIGHSAIKNNHSGERTSP